MAPLPALPSAYIRNCTAMRHRPRGPHIPGKKPDDTPDTQYRRIECIGIAPANDVGDVSDHRDEHEYGR